MWLWALINRQQGAEDRAADQDAIRRVAAGDASALAELYDRHCRPVYSLILRIVEDEHDGEDVMQDVFSQAWIQAGRYDASRGAVSAWLLMMARSRAIDRVRARRSRPDSLPADERAIVSLPDPGVPLDVELLTRDQIQQLRSAVARLPLLQRVALELAYYEGLTQNEIAARLEQPLGTVKTRIRTALIKLRDALAGAGA